MSIKDPKVRGEWVESVFMARAGERGLAVSKPWGDSRSYDFVVGRPGKFVSVQVKSTTAEMGGGYICAVKKNNERYARGSFDFLAAYVIPEDVWYIVPESKFVGRVTLILCSNSGEAKYEQYREAWHLLREAAGGGEEVVNEGMEAAEDAASEKSPLKLSLNGAPALNVSPGTDATPVSGVVGKRMENAFSFFRRQLEGGPFAPKKTEES